MYSSRPRKGSQQRNSQLQQVLFLLFFLDIYSKTLYIVINIFVLWFIVSVLPLSILRMVPTIIQEELLFDEISAAGLSSFLVLLKCYFLIFLSSLLVWWCLFPILTTTCNFPSLRAFWFVSSIPSTVFLLPLVIMSMAYFSMQNSIPIYWLYILFLFGCPLFLHFLHIPLCHLFTWGDKCFLFNA